MLVHGCSREVCYSERKTKKRMKKTPIGVTGGRASMRRFDIS